MVCKTGSIQSTSMAQRLRAIPRPTELPPFTKGAKYSK